MYNLKLLYCSFEKRDPYKKKVIFLRKVLKTKKDFLLSRLRNVYCPCIRIFQTTKGNKPYDGKRARVRVEVKKGINRRRQKVSSG